MKPWQAAGVLAGVGIGCLNLTRMSNMGDRQSDPMVRETECLVHAC